MYLAALTIDLNLNTVLPPIENLKTDISSNCKDDIRSGSSSSLFSPFSTSSFVPFRSLLLSLTANVLLDARSMNKWAKIAPDLVKL